MVLSVNGQETPTLDDFVKVLSQLPHGAPLAIRHYDIGSRSHVAHASTHLDRKWFQPSELRRCDHGGWTATQLPSPPEPTDKCAAPPRGETAETATWTTPPRGGGCDVATWTEPPRGENGDAVRAAVAKALVSVDFGRPYCIDGETGVRYRANDDLMSFAVV